MATKIDHTVNPGVRLNKFESILLNVFSDRTVAFKLEANKKRPFHRRIMLLNNPRVNEERKCFELNYEEVPRIKRGG